MIHLHYHCPPPFLPCRYLASLQLLRNSLPLAMTHHWSPFLLPRIIFQLATPLLSPSQFPFTFQSLPESPFLHLNPPLPPRLNLSHAWFSSCLTFITIMISILGISILGNMCLPMQTRNSRWTRLSSLLFTAVSQEPRKIFPFIK